MKRDPSGSGNGRGDETRQLADFFRDELRASVADAPSFEDLAAYVEGRLDPEERALLEERLAADSTLRQEVEDLRALHAQTARPRPFTARPLRMRIAVLAAAVAAAAAVLWLRPTPDGKVPPIVPVTAAPAPAPVASLKDGELRLALAADGAVSGLPAVDAATRVAVAAALRGALPAPQGLDALSTGQGKMLGVDAVPAFTLVSPLGTRVLTDRPQFHWTARPGTRRYAVAVFDQDLRRQLASGPVAGTEWSATTALPRGRTYLWQVTALDGGEEVTVPAPPAPEARFEVASPAVQAEMERRRAEAPASHLVAVVALVEAGLLDDGDAALSALEAENPGSAEVTRLREALTALRGTGSRQPR
jgi:hypothetical protein